MTRNEAIDALTELLQDVAANQEGLRERYLKPGEHNPGMGPLADHLQTRMKAEVTAIVDGLTGA